jgi:hypothetical protein
VALVLFPGFAVAERAKAPGDATVFIRLVGSLHAELDDPTGIRQSADLDRVEIGTGSGFVVSPHGYVLTISTCDRNGENARSIAASDAIRGPRTLFDVFSRRPSRPIREREPFERLGADQHRRRLRPARSSPDCPARGIRAVSENRTGARRAGSVGQESVGMRYKSQHANHS